MLYIQWITLCEGSYEPRERFKEKNIECSGLACACRNLGHDKETEKGDLTSSATGFPFLIVSHKCMLSFLLCLYQIFRHQRRVITAFMLACLSLRKAQNRLFISSGEGELDYFFLMLFVWRKRCWLTAELLDPTQPGFNADAWLMRSTTGIIIRQGILAFSCVSQAGKTSQCCNVKEGFLASVLSCSFFFFFLFTIQQHRAVSQSP